MMKSPKNKEPSIRQRKDRDETWEVMYYDDFGVRRRPTAKSEDAALLLKARIMTELVLKPTRPADILSRTVQEQAERFLHDLPYVGLQQKTIQSYSELVRRHILPRQGHHKVKDLDVGSVESFLFSLARDGYAKNTIRLVKSVYSLILDNAAKDHVLETNPLRALPQNRGSKKGPGKLSKSDRQKPVRPLSHDSLLRLYEAIHDMQRDGLIDGTYAILLTLYPKTGVRPSEGLGLQPGDIDFVGKTLRVCRSIETDGTLKDETKTGVERLVDLSDEMVAALRKHCEWLELELQYRGADEVPWLFPNEAGRPLDLAKVRKVFHRVLTHAGIHRHRLYDLRHSYASHLLNQGAPITYVAYQLGHANPDVTLRWYGRWLPSDKKSYAHLMDAPPAQSAATSSATKPQGEAAIGSQVVETTRNRRAELSPQPADTIS